MSSRDGGMTDLDHTRAGAPSIDRLSYGDLPAVLAIERRAFTTPWSLAMFVLELSKPSGVCLAATRQGGSWDIWSARATQTYGT